MCMLRMISIHGKMYVFFLDLLIRYKLRQFPGFVQDEKISCTKYTRDAMDGTPKVNALQFFWNRRFVMANLIV